MTAATIAIAIAVVPNSLRVASRAAASRCSLAFPTPSESRPLPPEPSRIRRRPFSDSVVHRTSNNYSSSSSSQNPPNAVQVPPPPSWSVGELRLSSTDDDDDKISEEELATLARRCLIDVRRLSPERRDRLRTHVSGIMRCASVLLDANNLDIDDGNNSLNGDDGMQQGNKLTDAEVYDAPRGLKKMPVRRENTSEENEDEWTLRDSGESKAVMHSESVQSKMIDPKPWLDDGEKFFSVVTKRE